MNSTMRPTFAERLGRVFGRMWQSCVRLDRMARARLVAQGYAPGAVSAGLLVVEVVAIGLLAYLAFWLVVSITAFVVVVWMIRHAPPEAFEESVSSEQTGHWRSVYHDPINHRDAPHHWFDDY